MGRAVEALVDARGTAGAQRRPAPTLVRQIAPRAVALAGVVVLAALTSNQADWQPIGLVVALAALMAVADVVDTTVRQIRISLGLIVQVVAMAMLGPAPAVAIGVFATLAESATNRVPPRKALTNLLIFALLGLAGGLAFEALRDVLGLDRRDTAYAWMVMPVYIALAAANLGLVAVTHRSQGTRILRETGLPVLSLELLSGVLAGAAVLVWAHAGLAAVATLLIIFVITLPIVRAVGDALTRGDDLLLLRRVSDQRAAEVARLSSDNARLLSEVLEAEQHERARLAESLHDGPVQRLVALRQDAAEGAEHERLTHHLDAALAETRAIISAFHPATVRELGFEASLRSAIAPFPAAEPVELNVGSALDDRALAGTLLLPVAQELVVNAVKHASPSRIDLEVRVQDEDVVLEVSDDGVGIDTSDGGRAVQAGHLGLAMVRRRVEDAGGVVDIETRADGGTRSRIVLPRSVV